MENYINPILTIILIAIYWFNTKAQNSKIKAQSDIINDLREHLKFFDLKKIKEYVELRETEKDKLLELTKQAIEKEFALKQVKVSSEVVEVKQDKNVGEVVSLLTENYIVEPLIYIAMNLVWKSEPEINQILDENFPKSKAILKNAIINAQSKIREKAGIDDLNEIKRQIESK